MIIPIRLLGDPVLRTPSHPIEVFDGTLSKIRDDMVETMYAAEGVGLAAPQVGLSRRLFVFDDGETGPTFIANPELFDAEGEATTDEGCLSIPGPYHPTARFQRVRCRGQDVAGTPFVVEGEDLLARILQHETDHLNGMLYIDRLDHEGRRTVLAELRQIELGLAPPRRKRRASE